MATRSCAAGVRITAEQNRQPREMSQKRTADLVANCYGIEPIMSPRIFLHHPPGHPMCVPGDSDEIRIDYHILYAVSRGVPLFALAEHIGVPVGKLWLRWRGLASKGILKRGADGRSAVARSNVGHLVSSSMMGKAYDAIVAALPPTSAIRVDDFGYKSAPAFFHMESAESAAQLAVRYVVRPLVNRERGSWHECSAWRRIPGAYREPMDTVVALAVEALTREIERIEQIEKQAGPNLQQPAT